MYTYISYIITYFYHSTRSMITLITDHTIPIDYNTPASSVEPEEAEVDHGSTLVFIF